MGEIPADLKDEAEEWHEKLVETAIEVDDAAMEAFFEGEVSGRDKLSPIRHLPISICRCAKEACVRLQDTPGRVCCSPVVAGMLQAAAAQKVGLSTGL